MARRKQEQPFDYLVKIVIIGDSAVGKTNILLRYVNQQYKITHVATIGVDFKVKTINIEGVKIKMQIWDTAGQQRFKTITQTYYKGAAGVVLVYSIADRKTFKNIENWLKEINESQPQTISKVIVGNKSDCSDKERQVTYEEGKQLAEKYGLQFVESSAKENKNIEDIFNILGRNIKKSLKDKEKPSTKKDDNIKIDNQKKQTAKNCSC